MKEAEGDPLPGLAGAGPRGSRDGWADARRRAGSPGLRRRSKGLSALLATLALAAACDPGATPGSRAERASPAPWPDAWRYDAAAGPTVADSGMVSTTDRYASEVGLAVLRDGGNAVDAAVAISFALAVVNPEAGNIGGGGFLVARMDSAGVPLEVALDYREEAPAAATRDMYLDAEGNVTDRSLVGHLAVGVPGTVMGMWEAHRRFGSLPWERLLQPAVDLAGGFVVTDRFTGSLTPATVEALRDFPASAAAWLPGGEAPAVGDTLRLPDLARTLERIRDHGADDFYRGETAALIADEMERGGGILTRKDLARYHAVWRAPTRAGYRGYTLLSMPPPSSGGVTMAEAANILEGWALDTLGWDSADRVHLVAEAFRRAYADRNHYLADPAFVDMPLETMTSDAYARFRASTIDMDRATPSSEVEPAVDAFGASPEGEQTTHASVVDARGNAVALTTTINSWYGSKVTVEGAGFLLNNEMDDFTAKPGVPNQFGLVQGENNAVAPGKRPLSAMSPTVVLDPEGDLFMVTGTPGGATIITTTWQIVSNVVDHGMDAAEAVLAPRVHHQHLPDQIYVEPDGLSPGVIAELRARGHAVVVRDGVSGDVQLILAAPDGRLHGSSDPRRGGAALGY